MSERIIKPLLWYALGEIMEIGLILLAIVFVIGMLVIGFQQHEIQSLFVEDDWLTPWEKAERKARKKAEREAKKVLKARRARKW